MTTFAFILLYALGVFVSYNIILTWNKGSMRVPEDYQNLFMLSLLSWGAFILYGIINMLNDSESN